MSRVYKDNIYGAKIETIQYLGYFLEEHIYGFRNNFSRCFRKLWSDFLYSKDPYRYISLDYQSYHCSKISFSLACGEYGSTRFVDLMIHTIYLCDIQWLSELFRIGLALCMFLKKGSNVTWG